jgi:long-chain acyl-CoA synthetase
LLARTIAGMFTLDCLGLFPHVTLDSPHAFKTLTEVFDHAIQRGANEPCLGHRAVLSTKPLKFADHYTWQTYAEVDVRRRNVGSALTVLFQQGVLGGGEMETVGIWSINRPG